MIMETEGRPVTFQIRPSGMMGYWVSAEIDGSKVLRYLYADGTINNQCTDGDNPKAGYFQSREDAQAAIDRFQSLTAQPPAILLYVLGP